MVVVGKGWVLEKVPLVAVVAVVAVGRIYHMVVVVVVIIMGMTICIPMTLDLG